MCIYYRPVQPHFDTDPLMIKKLNANPENQLRFEQSTLLRSLMKSKYVPDYLSPRFDIVPFYSTIPNKKPRSHTSPASSTSASAPPSRNSRQIRRFPCASSYSSGFGRPSLRPRPPPSSSVRHWRQRCRRALPPRIGRQTRRRPRDYTASSRRHC